MSKKSEILTKIVEVLTQLIATNDIKVVNYQTIKLVFSDFEGWELPAIQLIDQGELVEHEQGRARKTWDIVLEIVLKSSVDGLVDQQALFDLQYLVERTLWEVPNLRIPGMIDLKYLGSSTDLHMVLPYFYCRMDLQARYYDPLVSTC